MSLSETSDGNTWEDVRMDEGSVLDDDEQQGDVESGGSSGNLAQRLLEEQRQDAFLNLMAVDVRGAFDEFFGERIEQRSGLPPLDQHRDREFLTKREFILQRARLMQELRQLLGNVRLPNNGRVSTAAEFREIVVDEIARHLVKEIRSVGDVFVLDPSMVRETTATVLQSILEHPENDVISSIETIFRGSKGGQEAA